MKVLKWVGKILMVLASIIVIACAVIWVINRGWAGSMLRAGRPALQEGYRMRGWDGDEFRRFDGVPDGNGVRPRGGREGGFHGRPVSFGLGVLRIASRLLVFALVTAAVFLAGYLLGKRKPTSSRNGSPGSSSQPPVEPPVSSQGEEPSAS